MEKYYDLIVSLIKEHRKYNEQYENILDDIVNDVYSHSTTILNSVSDEEVIKSYLNKIISVSIITVPRNLGLNAKKQAVSISNENEPLAVIETFSEQSNADMPNLPEYTPNEETVVESNGDNYIDDYVEPEQTMENEEVLEKTPVVVENVHKENSDVDISLVDKMINGVSPEEQSAQDNVNDNNDLQYEEIPVQNESDDPMDLLYNDSTLPFEELSLNENLVEEVDSEPETFDVVEEAIAEESLNIIDSTPAETLDVVDSDESFENPENDESLDEELSDNILSEDAVLETFDYNEQDGLLESDETQNFSFDEVEDVEPLESAEELNVDLNTEPQSYVETKDDATVLIDYSPFHSELTEFSVDCLEIESVLNDINTKNPEKKILDICKLKYDDKKSVKDIANILDMTEESVLDSLCEIIDIVKDSYV